MDQPSRFRLVSLCRRSTSAKAMFRLAKALDGMGEVAKATSLLTDLLKLEGQSDNRDARAMLEKLRLRAKKEKKMFGGMFERARSEGGALAAPPAAPAA